jgi:hypothetical protein
MLPAVPALAQGDTSASAAAGFHDAVLASHGVLLRVPINGSGEENTSSAEMRLSAVDVPQGSDVSAAFNGATPIGADAVLPASTGPNSDSSTCGWYGWGNYGWSQPYYYSSYTPSYSYYNTSYSYSYSYSYSSSYSSYSPSYRYYYYTPSYYSYGGNYYNWYY